MWPWLLAALVPGAVYLPLTPAEPSAVRSIVKTLPLAILAAASAALSGPVLLTLALALSAIGDLALSRPGQRAFTLGLAAFALAHAAYLALFLNAWPNPLEAAPILLLAASTEVWLAPTPAPCAGWSAPTSSSSPRWSSPPSRTARSSPPEPSCSSPPTSSSPSRPSA